MKRMFLMIFLLCISYNVYAIDCPPSTTCTIPFQTTVAGLSLDGNYQLQVSATISYRINCDGDFEIIIDDFLGYNGNNSMNFLESFNYLHYSYSSATELVTLDFLMNSNAFGKDFRTIPLCSTNNSLKRVFLYTASCGIWTKCSYKLPNPIEKVCDTEWEGGDPHYGVFNPGPPPTTDMWVDHWRWHSCGKVCCKKEYELSRKLGYIEILSKTKSRYSDEEECSRQGDFWGKRPTPIDDTVELPCLDGC